MGFFKLMYLKKKKKLDNKGAALANVLLITTFVMVLTSSVLSMAYNSYRMKLINVSSKDNFYACEAVLEQIRTGFRNEFTTIVSEKAADTSSVTDEELAASFEAFYASYTLADYSVGTSNGINNESLAYYDLEKLSKLLTRVPGTNFADITYGSATIEFSNDNGAPVYSSMVVLTVDTDTDMTVTLQSNASGTNNFELTSTYVTFHDLTVIYTENGYESQVTTDITIEFPETGEETYSSGNKGGWVSLLDDRVKTYEDWETALATEEYEDYDFDIDSVVGGSADRVIINTTDYPANSVSYVIFDMQRYYETYTISQYGETWYGGSKYENGYYQYTPITPALQVQDGKGTGTQYAPCGTSGYDNVEIFVGPEGEEENDDYWVAYTDVFDEDNGYYVKDYIYGDYNSAAYRYVLKYGDDLQSADDYLNGLTENYTITYRVHLLDENDLQNSRGWILVLGTALGVNINPEMDSVSIYVDIGESFVAPTYYFDQYVDGNKQKGANVNEYTQYASNMLFMDFSESNYSVGDTLHITLSNVSSANYDITGNDAYYFTIAQQTWNSYGSTSSSYGTFYVTNTVGAPCKVVFDNTKNQEDIYITMTWDVYPYLRIQVSGTTGVVEVSTEWISGDGSSSSSTGDSSDAVIYYKDWRKE